MVHYRFNTKKGLFCGLFSFSTWTFGFTWSVFCKCCFVVVKYACLNRETPFFVVNINRCFGVILKPTQSHWNGLSAFVFRLICDMWYFYCSFRMFIAPGLVFFTLVHSQQNMKYLTVCKSLLFCILSKVTGNKIMTYIK